ncbi:MAG: hypothetical protein LBT73_00790 [Tannerellaceae bacterium]|jgi:hypothetical protein|nr:hypothetical protein [Tannerellaceae bacterium]
MNKHELRLWKELFLHLAKLSFAILTLPALAVFFSNRDFPAFLQMATSGAFLTLLFAILASFLASFDNDDD